MALTKLQNSGISVADPKDSGRVSSSRLYCSSQDLQTDFQEAVSIERGHNLLEQSNRFLTI